MKHLMIQLCGAIVMGITSTVALAQNQPALPTTAPSAQAVAAVPTTVTSPRVEVFPFTAVSGLTTIKDWTGRGIQESLQSDISRTGATLIMGPHELAATDDPIAMARQSHADLVVTGTYQVVDDQIRVNAHIIDVATNSPVSGFSATGSQHDLFKVEDALGEQLRSLLPRPLSLAAANQTFEQPQPATVYQESPVVESPPVVNNYYDTPPATPYYYPDYNYGYDYPDGLGFYGGFGFVYPGYGFRDYHDHDFHDRGGYDRSHFGVPLNHGGNGGIRISPGNGGAGFRGGFGGGMHAGGGRR